MRNHSPLWETYKNQGKTCPVVDMHGHMGPFPGIAMANIDPLSAVREMDKAGVRLLVFCHHGALLSPEIGNQANIDAVRQAPGRLRAYCGINPNYPEIVEQDVARFSNYPDVFVGFKFLADYHGLPVTDPRAKPAWEMADARKLPVLLHTWGGSGCNGYEQVREVAERYPNARILLGHSLHGHWDRALEIARSFPNTYLELTAVPDERGIVERFVDEIGSRRLLFGTDFPWFSFHYYIGAILGARLSEEDTRNILYQNASQLLAEQGIILE